MKQYLALVFLTSSLIGNCCSCTPLGKIDDKQYVEYALILRGKIIKVSETNFERIVTVKVKVYYKGNQTNDKIKIISPRQEGECGITPKVGEEWLMFTYFTNKSFYTNLCTRTKSMNPKALNYNKDELNNDLSFLESKLNNGS